MLTALHGNEQYSTFIKSIIVYPFNIGNALFNDEGALGEINKVNKINRKTQADGPGKMSGLISMRLLPSNITSVQAVYKFTIQRQHLLSRTSKPPARKFFLNLNEISVQPSCTAKKK